MKYAPRILLLIPLLVPLFSALTFGQHQATKHRAPSTGQAPPLQFAPGTLIAAELSKAVDAKKTYVGNTIEAKTTIDLLFHGQIILPRDTKVIGRVTEIVLCSKESVDSRVGLVFESLIFKGGGRLPIRAALQKIGPPVNPFTTPNVNTQDSEFLYAQFRNNEADESFRLRSGSTFDRDSTSASNLTNPISTIAVTTKTQQRVGVLGLNGVFLTDALLQCKKKNVHLESGTRMILQIY